MSDLRLIVTIKNAVMLRAMERAGFETAMALARASRVSNQTVGVYLNLKLAPMRADGTWAPSILRIADAHHCLPEDLFPPQFLRAALAKNRAERDVSADVALAYVSGPSRSIAFDPHAAASQKQALTAIRDALGDLRPADRQVLILRYGLNGAEPMTLEEVARAMGVTRERIRQREHKALRILRHPSRASPLKEAQHTIEETQA